MAWLKKPWVKYTLAGIGVIYIILGVGYLVYAGTRPTVPDGPSELEAHPEQQAQILAHQRAEELRTQLQLTDEQTKKLEAIFIKFDSAQSPEGDPRNRWRAQREEIEAILTPEQKALWEQLRGQMRGPGGPGGFGDPAGLGGPGGFPPPPPPGTGGPNAAGGPRGQLTPERIGQLKQSMTPDQQQRFDKAMQQMQRFRQGGGRGGGRGPRNQSQQ
jgi:hypothetical protein